MDGQKGVESRRHGFHDAKEPMPQADRLRVVINQPAPARIDTLQVNAFGCGG